MRHSVALHPQNRKELIIIKRHNSILNVIPTRESSEWYMHRQTHVHGVAIDRTECVHRTALKIAKQWHKWKNIENYKNYPQQLFCLGSNTLFRVVDRMVSIPLTLLTSVWKTTAHTHTHTNYSIIGNDYFAHVKPTTQCMQLAAKGLFFISFSIWKDNDSHFIHNAQQCGYR